MELHFIHHLKWLKKLHITKSPTVYLSRPIISHNLSTHFGSENRLSPIIWDKVIYFCNPIGLLCYKRDPNLRMTY